LSGRSSVPSSGPMTMSKNASPRRSERDSDRSFEGMSAANTPSPLDDPNLARVAIVGVIYIFQKPPELPVTPTPRPAAPPAAPLASVSGEPADAAADPAASSDAAAAGDADEKPEPATDESTDDPATAAPDAGADSKPKPDSEDKAGSGQSR